MPPAPIQFPLSSSPGQNPQESAGRLINAMVEKLGEGGRKPTKWIRPPGIEEFSDIPAHIHARGMFFTDDIVLIVLNERVYQVNDSGVATNLGSLDGTGLVTIAKNNKSPTPDIVVVTENGAFNLFAAGAPSSFADSDLPAPNSVTPLGGYLIFTTLAGEIWASGLSDITADALSFARAQSRSDNLLRGIAFRNEFFAFGSASIEVYQNVGSIPFPLSYVTMIPRGLAGQFAVAGMEEGWSNELIWVADDNVVYKLNGYKPDRISTHDVERAIEATADKTTLQATVYVSAGHAMWSLRSETFTWVYDLTTGQWHERHSQLLERWRASCSVKAFDKWLVGDEGTGKIFEVAETNLTEDGGPFTFTAISAPSGNFPNRIAVPRVDLDFVVGVGSEFGVDPIETDPVVSVSWSDDGGVTFSTPIVRPLGPQGETRTRVTINRCGMAGPGGRVWQVSCSDPVHIGLLGGAMQVEELSP